jgi:TolA-binding protein
VVLVLTAWVGAQEAQAPASETPAPPVIPQPPDFSRWYAQNRWDVAQAAENAAGYDRLKIADAIEAWKMLLQLYPQAGMANEAAWHMVQLTTRYGDLPRTIEAYEGYIQGFPDGDYAAEALWNLTYQYTTIPDWDAVYRKYDEFLKRFPQSPYGDVALNGLASNAQTKKKYDLAVSLYKELIQRYSTSDYCDDAWSAIGSMYVTAKDVDNTTRAYFTLASQYPYSSLVEPGINSLVALYYQYGDPLQAVRLGQAFLRAFPQSTYARYVRMYMYYAVMKAQVSIPGLEAKLPDFEDPNDPSQLLYDQCNEAYKNATTAAKLGNYGEAVRLYQQFGNEFPSSDKVDDAVYAIGTAFDSMQKYRKAAEGAKTPEQLGQVEADWSQAVSGLTAAGAGPIECAIDAYLVVARSMPGSDLRDDALFNVAQDCEKLENWPSAVRAYLDLVATFPVSTYASTAVSRLDALYPKLPLPADQATVMNAIITAYPFHPLADDYLYRLGVWTLLDGNTAAARDLFVRYVKDYPHRSKAAEALFWEARCEQLLGAGTRASLLYGQVAANFLQSGLADDAYVEGQYLRSARNQEVLQAARAALKRAAEVVGKPLFGYDAITRDHILILVPSDKAIDAREYNIADRLEQGYAALAQLCGGCAGQGERIEILVDPSVNAFTPGTPARIPVACIGPPPAWRQWYEAVAGPFMSDPAVSPVTTALPGIAQGLARFAALQLEDMLYADMGEVNIGATAVQNHLRDVNQAKTAALQALDVHVKAKATADKIDATIALGMLWTLSERSARVPGEIIDWTPLQPLLPAARRIPAPVAGAAQSLEQKAAVAGYWLSAALGQDQTALLKSWGWPITAEELQRVKETVEGPPKTPG